MRSNPFRGRTVRTGAIRQADSGYLLAGDSKREEREEPHTILLRWHKPDGWHEQQKLSWTTASACIVSSPKEHLVAVGEGGDFVVIGQGDDDEGNIFQGSEPRKGSGTMNGVYEVAGKAYAVGMGGFVYRRDEVMKWTRIDHGIPSGVDVQAISGFSENDIYAVGWKGAMWHFDGKRWSEKDTPTDVIFSSVCCAGDGKVYCCGQDGTVVVGRDDQWKVAAADATEEDLWDLEWFDGKLYISTMLFLYILKDDRLSPVDFGDDTPSSCYHLNSRDGVMWSIGAEDVLAFDGANWTRLL